MLVVYDFEIVEFRGFRVEGSGRGVSRVDGLETRGFGMMCSRFRVRDSGFGVFRVYGSG